MRKRTLLDFSNNILNCSVNTLACPKVYLCNGGEGCTAEIPTFGTNLPSDLNQLDIFYVFIISQ